MLVPIPLIPNTIAEIMETQIEPCAQGLPTPTGCWIVMLAGLYMIATVAEALFILNQDLLWTQDVDRE
jgi:hypothetical protein